MIPLVVKRLLRLAEKQRVYTFINIGGLAISLACVVMIMLYVNDELSYDKFHRDYKRIFRVAQFARETDGTENFYCRTGGLIKRTLLTEAPEVEAVTRIRPIGKVALQNDGKQISVKNAIIADSNFFQFFDFQLLEGSAVLDGANKIVITENVAKSLFNYETGAGTSPVGKTITLLQLPKREVIVSGIVRNPPHNSHFHFDCIISETEDFQAYSWIDIELYNYVKLAGPPETLEARLPNFYEKYVGPELTRIGATHYRLGNDIYFFLQPLASIHLDSRLSGEIEQNGNRLYVYILSFIGLMMLGLACLNFVNLLIARSTTRAKEVGIRKTIGATRSILVKQFFIETTFQVCISLVLALFIVSVSLNAFNFLTSKALTMSGLLTTPSMIVLISACAFLVVGSTLYPALYLSSFNPVAGLKNRIPTSNNNRIRNVLVLFQFATAITFIVFAAHVYTQTIYLEQRDLGLETERLLCIENARSLGANAVSFKEYVKRMSPVANASLTEFFPSQILQGSWTLKSPRYDQFYTFDIYETDKDHLATLGLTLVQGRFIDESDSTQLVVNESAANILGVDLTKQKEYLITSSNRQLEIIGVVRDFHYESLHAEIQPLLLRAFDHRLPEYVLVRFDRTVTTADINSLRRAWKKFSDSPFDFVFVNQTSLGSYRSERALATVTGIFTLVSLMIACIGLIGLMIFSTSQRTKEIGIRKVLGASLMQLITLLSMSLARTIIVAFLLAIPLSIGLVEYWLQSFPYRINVSWISITAASLSVLTIALVVIVNQSARVSLTKPVESLKSE